VIQRSILRFEDGIKAEKTLISYRDNLNRFFKFVKIKDFDSLAGIPPRQIQDLIIDYIRYLKKTVSHNSVSTMMTGVKHFFVMNEVILNWEFIRKTYPAKVKAQGFRPWSTSDIEKMLNATKSLRNKAIIHFMASTGCRLGAFDELNCSHLKDMGDNYKSVLIYADSTSEYWSFLTPEASTALEDYFEQRRIDGERFAQDSPIFRQNYQIGIEKVKKLNSNSIKNMMFRLISSNSNIQRKKVGKNYDIQIDHGFRKRFNTIMKLENSVNANIAEKILGHRNGLDGVYFKPTIEQCLEEFKKATPNLTISDKGRDALRIKNLEQETDRIKVLEEALSHTNSLDVDPNNNPNQIIDIVNKILDERHDRRV